MKNGTNHNNTDGNVEINDPLPYTPINLIINLNVNINTTSHILLKTMISYDGKTILAEIDCYITYL